MVKTTSRDYLFDAIELLQNSIAICSHAQELINVYNVDYSTAEDEEAKEIYEKIQEQTEILGDALTFRREIQKQIFSEWDWDHKVWCQFKHAVALHGYAVECWYANLENDSAPFWSIKMQEAYELMVKVMSKFLGADEMVTCGRCLLDQLNDAKDKSKKPSEKSDS